MKYAITRISLKTGEIWFTPDVPLFRNRGEAIDFIENHLEMLDVYAAQDPSSKEYVWFDNEDKDTRIDVLRIPDVQVERYFHPTTFAVVWQSDNDGAIHVSKVSSKLYGPIDADEEDENFITELAECLQGKILAVTPYERFSNDLDIAVIPLENN